MEGSGKFPDRFHLTQVGPIDGPVASKQGPRLHADHAYADAPEADVLLVPGGMGTRRLVHDDEFLRWLALASRPAGYVLSVCTGSALLAKARLLDGYAATSNKCNFAWVREQSAAVKWIAKARWVHDRDRWTSSGVAAGMDMTVAFIEHLHGRALAERLVNGIEYEWHDDSSWDPFAAIHGVAGI